MSRNHLFFSVKIVLVLINSHTSLQQIEIYFRFLIWSIESLADRCHEQEKRFFALEVEVEILNRLCNHGTKLPDKHNSQNNVYTNYIISVGRQKSYHITNKLDYVIWMKISLFPASLKFLKSPIPQKILISVLKVRVGCNSVLWLL